MSLEVTPDVYAPSINDNGMYVDEKIKMINGMYCPCNTLKDKVYDTVSKFTTHTKTKMHQKWLKQLNQLNCYDKFEDYLINKDYDKLNKIGIVFNISNYITWMKWGNKSRMLFNYFEITQDDEKLYIWFIDNFINFVSFDIHKMNEYQKKWKEDEVTYEDNIYIHMEQLYTNAIYNGKKDIVHYLLKKYPKIDKYSFDYSLCCCCLKQTPEMIETLLSIDKDYYILHDGVIKLKEWISEDEVKKNII